MSNQFGNKLKELRLKNNLYQKHIANALNIDTPLYSKIERGERKAKKEQLVILSDILKINMDDLTTVWLADQVLDVLKDEKLAKQALKEVSDNINQSK